MNLRVTAMTPRESTFLRTPEMDSHHQMQFSAVPRMQSAYSKPHRRSMWRKIDPGSHIYIYIYIYRERERERKEHKTSDLINR